LADELDIEAVRRTFLTEGWRNFIAPGIAAKMDEAKIMAVVSDHERVGEYKTWSNDRVGGFVLGLGWAPNHFFQRVQLADKQRAHEAVEARMREEAEVSHGTPHAVTATDREDDADRLG
jgi:hypothetical protein